jgi:hypothetical protein
MKNKFFLANLFIVITLFNSCSNKADKEMYSIPYGFTGRVVIFYNQTDGKPEKYEEGYRVLEIPEDGILKTQFKPNYGVIKNSQANQKFYWKSVDGKASRILNRNDEPIDSNIIQVFSVVNGNRYPILESKEIINGEEKKVTKTSDSKIAFRTFIIDKYSNREKYDFKTGFEEESYWSDIQKKADIKANP